MKHFRLETWVFLIIVGVIIVTAYNAEMAPDKKSADSGNIAILQSVESTASSSTPLTAIAPAQRPWLYSTSTDEMSGKYISLAKISSIDKQDLHWPYGHDIGATLTLVKHPRWGKMVSVSLDNGQILCRSYESCTILIRFDDHTAIKYSAIGPDDGSTKTVFIKNYTKFLESLKRSKKVLIELPMYQDGNLAWQFEVVGLSWQ
jgi:hypothetical protein